MVCACTMPSVVTVVPIVIAIFGVGVTIVSQRIIRTRNIRRMLPNDLDTWRIPGGKFEDEERIWRPLAKVFQEGGLALWPATRDSMQRAPDGGFPLSSGYAYATSSRGVSDGIGTASSLRSFNFVNGLTRIARTRDGHDVAVRVIVIKKEGHEHLKILRKIAAGPLSLLSNNHSLPMLSEFQFEDIIFGIFPKVGGTMPTMQSAFASWPKNSVGDVMDLLMQALEALSFLHASNIAHRDAFRDNFLIQWHPESLRTMSISASRPRVYLIDFEVAVEFPADRSPSERVCTGYPLGGSFTQADMYSRPLAPEITTSEWYCPFKLDIWQLGSGFESFRSNIREIDELIRDLACPDPASRMDADTALKKLGNVISTMPPASLLIAPHVIENRN